MNLFRADKSKDWWLAEQYTPFDQGARENFFLAATSFLFTNYDAGLAQGCYFEFGCHKARTMRYCWRHTRHNFDLIYYAFDSFEGLPEPTADDVHPGWKKGSFSMSEAEFVDLVVKDGMPRSRLHTVKGFYEDSLPRLNLIKPATIVYIDCDLYSSAVSVLRFLPKFLQRGTLIAFDDWNCYLADPNKGERRAWREFCEANPSLRFEPFYSTHMLQSFVTVTI